MSIHGVHTALATPLANGEVDVDAYARLCVRQVENGIHGLVACGTTGEAPTLTLDEWASLVSTAVQVGRTRPGVTVTAGVGTNCTRTTLERIEQATALGADCGLLVLPYYNKPNPDGLRAHVQSAAACGLPLMVYHVPGRTGQRVSASLLAELAEVDGVVAVKEATGDIRYGTDVARATTQPVLSGDDFTFLALLAQGGQGVVSVVSNVDPARTVAVYEHARAGRYADAQREFGLLWDLIGYLFSDTNPVPCKAALAELGLCRPDVRAPLAANPVVPEGLLAALGLRS